MIMMTMKEYHRWRKRPRGYSITYYRGFLMKDREPRAVRLEDGSVDVICDRPLNILADEMLRLAEKGECYLFQRRLSEGQYDYIAVRA